MNSTIGDRVTVYNHCVITDTSVASDASDLNGDALSYAKVSGPAWLNVAANGGLSGVPATIDANTNSFVISATDSGGLSNTLTLFIYVNGAPSFTADPFTMPGIIAGHCGLLGWRAVRGVR